MLLLDFINEFDKPGKVVLLEGKRNVLQADQQKLFEVGEMLARKTKHILFRSGNAQGADEYFSKGVCSVHPARLQVILPYKGHRKTYAMTTDQVSLDSLDMVKEADLVYYTSKNGKNKGLIDLYLQGKKSVGIKAAYLLRDTLKVTGTSTVPKADFALFYDDLTNPGTGGTGHTMQMCDELEVPYIDQRIYFNWIKKV